jgi:hypothetical protein
MERSIEACDVALVGDFRQSVSATELVIAHAATREAT